MSSQNYISSKISISDYEIIRLKRKDSETWFSVIPSYGGALNEFVINRVSICMGASSKLEFETQTIQSFAGAQLFPYPNRVKNAIYKYDGKQFKLSKNDSPLNHSLHGLIYNQPFVVDNIDHKLGKLESSYMYQKKHLGFPFEVHLKNTYQLEKEALTIYTTIENKGDETFPFGHGWHPYFKTDDIDNDWQLQIAADKYYPVNKDLIPYGTTNKTGDFLKSSTLNSKELDYCFKLRSAGSQIKAVLKSSKTNVEIAIELDGYQYLQAYIPSNRKSIALEPQTCAPNAFNNQIGLLHLKPKHKMEFKFKIKVVS